MYYILERDVLIYISGYFFLKLGRLTCRGVMFGDCHATNTLKTVIVVL
jgi:hypothetical protein